MSDERHETVSDNVSVKHQFREVAKMIPHEEVDVSKMETTTSTSEKSSAVGNAAAMREAMDFAQSWGSTAEADAKAFCALPDLYDAARRAYVFLAHSSLMGAVEVRKALEDALLKAGGAE